MSFGFGLRAPMTTGWTLASAVQSLFGFGEQGVWYDVNDLTTLYQDSAGITPCSTPGQGVAMPVGLMLDKHKGLLETAVTVSSWNSYVSVPYETFASSGSTITSAINTTSSAYCYTSSLSLVSGNWYKLTINLTHNSGIAPQISTGNNGSSNNLGSLSNKLLVAGANTIYFLYNGDANTHLWLYNSAATDFSLTISVNSVPGNHAYQSTSASRPALSGRVNQLLNTNLAGATVGTPGVLPTNWTYINSSGLSTQIVATGIGSDGNGYVDIRYFGSATAGGVSTIWKNYVDAQTISASAGMSFTASINLALVSGSIAGASTASLYVQYGDSGLGTLTGSQANLSSVSAEYTRFTNTFAATDATTAYVRAFVNFVFPNGTAVDFTMRFSAPDLRVANDSLNIPSYQRVVDALTYDTTGFPLYLSCDGVDDGMVTNSIDFSASDKMFVATGIRKLSDAAIGIVAQLGVTGVDANASSLLNAPRNAGVENYATILRSSGVEATLRIGPFNTPETAVISINLDRSGTTTLEQIQIRRNGLLPTQDAYTAGDVTGDFGNSQLYLFRRGDAAYPFTGRFYNLVVRGGALPSDTQVAQVETYLNKTTQAY